MKSKNIIGRAFRYKRNKITLIMLICDLKVKIYNIY